VPVQSWMSKKEAAQYMGVSRRQIERLAERGELRKTVLAANRHRSSPVYFPREDVEACYARKLVESSLRGRGAQP
jgi:excisionase family DNA binding protein